jgi:hypothetical protein
MEPLMAKSEPGIVTTSAEDLMAAADRLAGVCRGMTHIEIRAALERATPARQRAQHLVFQYRATAPHASGERADIMARLQRIADDEPEALRGLAVIKKGEVARLVENGVFVNREPRNPTPIEAPTANFDDAQDVERRRGRPRKHPSDLARHVAASRAYRQRKKAHAAAERGALLPADACQKEA